MLSCFGYWKNDCPELLERTSHALAVIERVNLLGHAKRSLLVFNDRHGRVIGDYTPTAGKTDDTNASVLSALNDLVPSEMPGVFLGEEGSADELP